MEIEKYTAITLNDDDIRKAIVEYVAKQNAGDGPEIDPDKIQWERSDGRAYNGKLQAVALACNN